MRSAQEKQKDMQELELLRQKELAEKRSRTLLRGARWENVIILGMGHDDGLVYVSVAAFFFFFCCWFFYIYLISSHDLKGHESLNILI